MMILSDNQVLFSILLERTWLKKHQRNYIMQKIGFFSFQSFVLNFTFSFRFPKVSAKNYLKFLIFLLISSSSDSFAFQNFLPISRTYHVIDSCSPFRLNSCISNNFRLASHRKKHLHSEFSYERVNFRVSELTSYNLKQKFQF